VEWWCVWSGGVCGVVGCVEWWCVWSGGVCGVVVCVEWWCVWSGGVCVVVGGVFVVVYGRGKLVGGGKWCGW
jgi:hypothetical protein